MKTRKSRDTHLLELAIVSLLGMTLSCSKQNTAQVLVVNKTQQAIGKCTIKLAAEVKVINGLAPNSGAVLVFQVNVDAHYDVIVQFSDGRTLSAQIGCVTPGFDYKDVITVYADSIDLAKQNEHADNRRTKRG